MKQINQKRKGISGERELVHRFWETGDWVAIRVAGSGAMRYPSPDIVAANAVRRMVIECKVTKERNKYLTKKEIEELQRFGKLFGAEPWIAVKFDQWYFLAVEDLQETGQHYVASLETAKMKGLLFEELIM